MKKRVGHKNGSACRGSMRASFLPQNGEEEEGGEQADGSRSASFFPLLRQPRMLLLLPMRLQFHFAAVPFMAKHRPSWPVGETELSGTR